MINLFYIDKNLKHPLIEILKKKFPYKDIEILENRVPELDDGVIFVAYQNNLIFSTKCKIILCYKTDQVLDFSSFLEKIWWDYLEESYYVSVLNMQESYKYLGEDFNVFFNYNPLKMDNPLHTKSMFICNAYTFCSGEGLEDTIYSVITSASYRKKVHSLFEYKILGIEENSLYKIKLLDEYTFSIRNYPYLTKTQFDIIPTLKDLVNTILSFKNVSRELLGDNLVGDDVIDEHFYKVFNYIKKNKTYPEGIIEELDNFYNKNKKDILSFQSFSQNNCNLHRCLLSESHIIFDYFSLYNAKEHYTSFLVDLSQLLLGILQYYSYKNDFKSVPIMTFYINLIPKEYRDYVFFFCLLEDYLILNPEKCTLLINLFKK